MTMDPIATGVLLAVLGLVPLVLVVATSFAKQLIVFSLLRNALGAPSVPPTLVITALAFMLSAIVMAPVAQRMGGTILPMLDDPAMAEAPPSEWIAAATDASEPWVAFLAANAGDAEVAAIARMQDRELDPDAPMPLTVALPAFTLTELAEAFQIGFLLFLPFLVLDLLIGSVLLSLGMHMLSPTTVSLPFKLLLFVLVEGWLILGEALVVGYTYPWVGG